MVIVSRLNLRLKRTLVWARTQIAVEVLTPHNMTRNTHQPVARVIYRAACLRAWGYAVVSVPWHEWAALCTGGSDASPRVQSAKEDYLLRLLAPLLSDGGRPQPEAAAEEGAEEALVPVAPV